MPALLDLSNELLFKIIDQIHPDDIPNFSLTCKDIHHVAKDALEFHLDREETYEDVVLDGCHRHEDYNHPLEFIEEMCMDWRIGEYVKNLKIECCSHPSGPDNSPEEEHEEDLRKYEKELREDIIMSQTTMQVIQPYVEEKAVERKFTYPTRIDVESLCSEAARGKRMEMIALLLLFIPNLKSLELIKCSPVTKHLRDMIFTISEQNEQWSSGVRKLLTNLESVMLEGDPDNRTALAIEPLLWFATIPSMRTLLGNYVHGVWGARCQMTLPRKSSNVKKVCLWDSAVREDVLEQLLVGMDSLESFTYFHNTDIANGHGMNARKILSALHQYTKHSLKFLDLWGFCEPAIESGDTISNYLQSFEVLKELQLSSSVYLEMLYWHGTPEGRCRREDIQPLVYFLPPSIEQVTFFRFPNFGYDPALFVDFTEERDRRLPNLKEIIFYGKKIEGGEECWTNLVEACEKVGVKLTINLG